MLENRNRKKKKKQKRENSKKPYKNRVFLRWSYKSVKNHKKWIFSQNCLTLFVSGRETKKRIFVATICFGQNFFFGPKQCKAEKNYKNRGFSGYCPKAKMTPFLGKRCLLTWWKKWVLLTVFLKSCVSWKHYFYSVFSKTQFYKNKNCMLKKNRKFMKNSGLFLNMAKWCFLGVCFL